MATSIIPAAAFPNVPSLPGVPQMARSALVPTANGITLGSQSPATSLWKTAKTAPKWGVFDSKNKQVLSPDSITEFDNRNESTVSEFPIQDGTFASYNKVATPFSVGVRMSKGGTLPQRAAFLLQLDTLLKSFELYTVLTPEKSYLSCNLERYEVARRGVNGAYFLTEVDLYFTQILQVTAQYENVTVTTTSAEEPQDQPAVNQGTVASQSLTGTEETAADSALAEVK